MREKNRNSIENIKKLPQFTTMNVIDGQAGLVNYSSLILYSLTIDNILNIIIMIILATVAINYLFGENGLITRAQQAKEMSNIENVREKLEMAKGTAAIDGKGNIEPDHYFDILEEEGIIGDKDTDVIDNGNGTYEVTTVEGYIFIITIVTTPEGETDLEIEYSGTADGPRIVSIKAEGTTNSINIEVDARNVEGATYTYRYKLTNEEEWKEAEQSKNNTCTINDLVDGETYDIEVTVETNEGSITRGTSVHLGELPEGTITFESEWIGDGTARVTINTSAEGYRLQYQINAVEENDWKDIENGGIVENLTYPSTVYARIFDGKNGSEHASETLEDKTVPSVTVTPNGTTSNSVSVTAVATDAESGMKDSLTYTYSIKVTGQDDSTYTTPSGASNINSNTYTFTGLTQGTNYTVRVEVNGDKANNVGTGTLENQTTGSIPSGEGDSELEEGAITFGETTWSNNKASVTVNTSETGYKIEYQVNTVTEGNWTEISNGGEIDNLNYQDTVYARLTDGTNHGEYASYSVDDQIAPTVTVSPAGTTSNSVSVTANATDGQSGMKDSLTYTYSYKVTGQDDSTYTTPSGASNISSNSYTFTGLTQGTNYTIRVQVNGDKANNVGTGTLADQTTGSIPSGAGDGELEEGAITFGETTWSNNKASVTVNTSETGYKIEYQINTLTEGNWKEIANGGEIDNLNYQDTVYARLTDGNNHGDYASHSVDDQIAPTVTVSPAGTTSNSVSVTASAADAESGMKDSLTYKYSIKVTGQDDSTYTTPSNAQNITANTYTFTGLTQGTNYTVRVQVNGDKANNIGIGTLANQTTGSIPGGETGVEQGLITFGTPQWNNTNGQASVTVNTTTEYDLEYQIGSVAEGSWTDIESGQSVGGLTDGQTLYARLTDGTNAGEEATITIDDKTAPTISNIELTSTENSVTVTVTASDNESGVGTYTYTINGGSQASNSSNTHTFTGLSASTSYTVQVTVTDRANNPVTDSKSITTKAPSGIPETTSYVGYYADVNGDNSVDGIIYADLAIGGSGEWNPGNNSWATSNNSGDYTIPKKSGLKKYKVEGTYNGDFGNKGIVKPNGGSGNERFYVMALEDIDKQQNGTYYSWYESAYGNMSDYATYTSGDFGAGEQNTSKMITKWNASGYGSQNADSSYPDVWGLSAVQSGTWNGSSGWYVPSRGEWAAFGGELGITQSNYSSKGLSYYYWSSSQYNTNYAWYAGFSIGYMDRHGVRNTIYVRLGTTF